MILPLSAATIEAELLTLFFVHHDTFEGTFFDMRAWNSLCISGCCLCRSATVLCVFIWCFFRQQLYTMNDTFSCAHGQILYMPFFSSNHS